jgi:hypothetical protein
MTPETSNAETLLHTDGTAPGDDTDAAMRASAHQLAARLARLDLDAGTLEMVMAALATDVCDHIDVDGAAPDD